MGTARVSKPSCPAQIGRLQAGAPSGCHSPAPVRSVSLTTTVARRDPSGCGGRDSWCKRQGDADTKLAGARSSPFSDRGRSAGPRGADVLRISRSRDSVRRPSMLPALDARRPVTGYFPSR